jgi:hypothetical protein
MRNTKSALLLGMVPNGRRSLRREAMKVLIYGYYKVLELKDRAILSKYIVYKKRGSHKELYAILYKMQDILNV